jgi:hypothetical protein
VLDSRGRMPGELSGVVHGVGLRVASACFVPWRNRRPVSGPRLTEVAKRCKMVFGIRVLPIVL